MAAGWSPVGWKSATSWKSGTSAGYHAGPHHSNGRSTLVRAHSAEWGTPTVTMGPFQGDPRIPRLEPSSPLERRSAPNDAIRHATTRGWPPVGDHQARPRAEPRRVRARVDADVPPHPGNRPVRPHLQLLRDDDQRRSRGCTDGNDLHLRPESLQIPERHGS